MRWATILLVEDDQELGGLLAEVLEFELPVTVIWVRSIQEAECILSRSTAKFLAGMFDRTVIGGKTDDLIRKFSQAEPCAATFNISGEVEAQEKGDCRFQFPKPIIPEKLFPIFEGLFRSA